MTILKQIIEDKKEEVAASKKIIPLSILKDNESYNRNTFSIKERLGKVTKPGIIAEHKRKSPSKGIINDKVKIEVVVKGYQDAGVQAVSILTDYKYFMGMKEDMVNARKILNIPMLRKEFIIDNYQVHEAKYLGADFILLIAACLSKIQSEEMAGLAHELGMEVLVEIHDETELVKIPDQVDLIGVNNRNLMTFEVDVMTSIRLATSIPDQYIKISESGISAIDPIQKLWEHGYKGFLIGENFMKNECPGESCKEFLAKI